jgi:hypothetical protein
MEGVPDEDTLTVEGDNSGAMTQDQDEGIIAHAHLEVGDQFVWDESGFLWIKYMVGAPVLAMATRLDENMPIEEWETRWINWWRQSNKLMMQLVIGSSVGELDGTVIELGATIGSSKEFKCGRSGTVTELHKGSRAADLLDLREWST